MTNLATTHRLLFVLLGSISLGTGAGCGKDTLRRLSTKTDEFVQNAAAKIDVLWVVDNSSSMGEEQQGLGESFRAFIDNLIASGVDYQIGVVSTDPADLGKFHKGASNTPIIANSTANSQAVFLENVKVGTGGSASERGFATAAQALGKGVGWTPGEPVVVANPGFPRDEASLFIIMVSDEDDESFGPVSYYRRLFESYKGPGNEGRISVSGIVSPPAEPEPCFEPARGRAYSPGVRYGEIAAQTGGIIASICSDFTQSLAELSLTAAGLKSIFTLSSLPNLAANITCPGLPGEPFCVRVNDVPLAKGGNRDGWAYDDQANTIIFGVNAVPGPQDKITVEYQELPQ